MNNYLKFERKIYQIFGLQLGRPIRVKAILYFFVFGGILFGLRFLPLTKILLGWIPPIFLIATAVGLAWLLADVGTEGRNPLSFFKSFIHYNFRKSQKKMLYRGRFVNKPSYFEFDKYITMRAEKFPKGEVNLNAIALHDFAPIKEIDSLEKLQPLKEPISFNETQTQNEINKSTTLKGENKSPESKNKNTEAVSKTGKKAYGDKKLWVYGLGIVASLLLMCYVGYTTLWSKDSEVATPQEIEENEDYNFIEYEYNDTDKEKDLSEWVDDNGSNKSENSEIVDNTNKTTESGSTKATTEVNTGGEGSRKSSSVEPSPSTPNMNDYTNDEHTYYASTNVNGTTVNSNNNSIVRSSTDYISPNNTNNISYRVTAPQYSKPQNQSNVNVSSSGKVKNYQSSSNNVTNNITTSTNQPNGSSDSTPSTQTSSTSKDNTSIEKNSEVQKEYISEEKFSTVELAWLYIDDNMVNQYLNNGYIDWEIVRVQQQVNNETKDHDVFYQVKWLSKENSENNDDLKYVDVVKFKAKSNNNIVYNNGNVYRTLMVLEKDLKNGLINEMKKDGLEHWWVRKVRLDDDTFRYTVDFYDNSPIYQVGNTGKVFETKKEALSWINDNYSEWFDKGYTLWSVYSIYDTDSAFTVNFQKVATDVDSVGAIFRED